jgi:hypothetical protein
MFAPRLRRAVPALVVALTILNIGSLTASATAEADAMALSTTLTTSAPMKAVPAGFPFPGSVGYSLGGASSGCMTSVQLPPLQPVSVPVSFAEAPTLERGTCTALTGSGTFLYDACMSGLASGSATLQEPSGETVSIDAFTVALFSGVGTLAASPAHGGGYGDDGGMGSIAGPALLVPQGTDDECVFSDTTFDLTMVLAAAR